MQKLEKKEYLPCETLGLQFLLQKSFLKAQVSKSALDK